MVERRRIDKDQADLGYKLRAKLLHAACFILNPTSPCKTSNELANSM